MSNAKRVGIYVRVSTHDQSYEIQEKEIGQYAIARGWTITSLYADKATGTNGNRAELKRLLSDCQMRQLDLVIVWKLDRFARSLKDLILMLQQLSELGIEFISIRDNIDLSTSSGKLMLHIIGAFAEFEASIIKTRVKAGLDLARSKGTRLGRKPTIDAMKVRELRAQGYSLGKIAKYLGVSKAGVHKSLSENSFTNTFNKAETIRTEKAST